MIGEGGKYPGQTGSPLSQKADVTLHPLHGFIQTFNTDDFNPRIKGNDRIDENAVRRMGYLMLHKMQRAADDGKTGWWNERQCSHESLMKLLETAVSQGKWIDAANYAMMIQIRQEIKHGPTVFSLKMPGALMR